MTRAMGALESDGHVTALVIGESAIDVHGVVFVRRRVAVPVVTCDPDTDGATGTCACSACGATIEPDDAFCRCCGASLGGVR